VRAGALCGCLRQVAFAPIGPISPLSSEAPRLLRTCVHFDVDFVLTPLFVCTGALASLQEEARRLVQVCASSPLVCACCFHYAPARTCTGCVREASKLVGVGGGATTESPFCCTAEAEHEL
jgi:hypothetical protein